MNHTEDKNNKKTNMLWYIVAIIIGIIVGYQYKTYSGPCLEHCYQKTNILWYLVVIIIGIVIYKSKIV